MQMSAHQQTQISGGGSVTGDEWRVTICVVSPVVECH